MARIIALDYGEKRVGIAATDPLKIIVSGLDTLSPNDCIDFLRDYCENEEVEMIVMGQPLHPDGNPMPIFQRIQKFADRIQKLLPSIPIVFHDETLTSKRAVEILIDGGYKKKQRRNKELIDKMSAILILEDYLGIY